MATTAQIREHYDSLALIYSTFWGDHIHHGLFETGNESAPDAQVKMLSHCVGLLGLHGSERVLDCGCGHGGTLLHLATSHGCSGLGLTLSPKQAKIASQNAAKAGIESKIKFQVRDVGNFVFPKDEFDLVWAMESTEHFPDKPPFFRNVAATLRPGGQSLLAAWTGSMGSSRVAEVAQAFLCPELWTAEQYRAAIEFTGMRVTNCEDLTAKIIRTWEICQQHARTARAVVKLLPQAAREFVEGIDIILDAYRSGDLSYTVITARK
jgi:Cyclopropane fatty acid synthase and related methyltransferases